MKHNRKSKPWGAIAGAALLLGFLAGGSGAAEPAESGRFQVVVKETAGIRRFGYPVNAVLSLAGPVKKGTGFRLLEKAKAVPAQFRLRGKEVHLDFNVSHAPGETREYVVEYSPKVEEGPAIRGMKIVAEEDQFRVVYSPSLQFAVPRNLLGLLRGVKTAKMDYLRPGSVGLFIQDKDRDIIPLVSKGSKARLTKATIVKEGPLASTLRFEATQKLIGGQSVASVIDMDFPLSKSWVRVTWTVADPKGLVAGLGADLNLNIQGEPALLDFGASTYVYAHLRKGQEALLEAASGDPRTGTKASWKTLLGPKSKLQPYVTGDGTAEGWAHVMDRERCTAVAVADFAGAGAAGTIRTSSEGRLRIVKEFARKGKAPPAGKKTLTFWLHFVDMPVQVGAATSPQAMLAPLRVEVKREK